MLSPGTTAADNFRLPAGAPPVACVDIGGTKVAVSVADAADRKSTRLNSSHCG